MEFQPESLWSSLEAAKVVVPLAIAVAGAAVGGAVGAYLTYLYQRKIRQEDRAQARYREQEAIFQRLGVAFDDAGTWGLRMVGRRCWLEALLQIRNEQPGDAPGLDDALSETKGLYRRDFEAFERAQRTLNEVVISARFAFSDNVISALAASQNYLGSLAGPTVEGAPKLRESLIENFRACCGEHFNVDELNRLASERIAGHLQPVHDELERLTGNVGAAIRSELTGNH